MSVTLGDLRVKKVKLHALGETGRVIIIVGEAPTYQVLHFVGPTDPNGFVGCSQLEVNEATLESYVSGLRKVWKTGSSFSPVRCVTSTDDETVTTVTLGQPLFLQTAGKAPTKIGTPVHRILMYSSDR